MRRTRLLLILLVGIGWWLLPASEAEASSCLTRTALVAMPNGSLVPTLCNQYGQLYAVSVNEDGTQIADAAPQSLIVDVRYELPYWRRESPYLHRTAGGDSLTCTTSSTPHAYQIGQPVPVSCNQYGQLLVELSGVGASAISESTVAELPGAPPSGTIRIVTDGASATDCTTGTGSTRVLCNFDGSSWVALGGAGTLDQAFDSGKTIDGANSLANAMRVGDGITPICLYTDATLGPQVRPCTDANVATIIPTNFNWSLWDIEGAAAIETVDPDAASTLAMWTYGAAYRPKKQAWLGAGSLDGDGTQCPALATTVTINSGPKIPTFICTENDASTLYGSFKLVDNWDAGTITVTHVYIQTAADTGSMLGEVSMQCHGNGETVDSTYGTMVELDDAAVTGSNKNDFITSTAVTPAGTCAAGDMLYFRWQYDGTGNPTTAAATLNHVGFMLKYSETSRSN